MKLSFTSMLESVKAFPGRILWVFSPETLEEEPERKPPPSRFGQGGFLGWLLGVEPLQDESASAPPQSRFGEKGFLRWLFSTERLPDAQERSEGEKRT